MAAAQGKPLLQRNPPVWALLTKGVALQVLVVDECSMVDAEYLDHLSIQVGSMLHYHEAEHSQGGSPDADLKIPEARLLPFGGEIQLIFCGDFLQVSSCIWMGSNTMSPGPPFFHRNPPPASLPPNPLMASTPHALLLRLAALPSPEIR